MSVETQELVNICERLPQAMRAEVADFARFLLATNEGTPPPGKADRWLATASGSAKQGLSTDDVMGLTRGEP